MLTRSIILSTSLAVGLVVCVGAAAIAAAVIPGDASGVKQHMESIAAPTQDPATGTSASFIEGGAVTVAVAEAIVVDGVAPEPTPEAKSTEEVAPPSDTVVPAAPASNPASGTSGSSGTGSSSGSSGSSGSGTGSSSGNSGHGNKDKKDKKDKTKKDKKHKKGDDAQTATPAPSTSPSPSPSPSDTPAPSDTTDTSDQSGDSSEGTQTDD